MFRDAPEWLHYVCYQLQLPHIKSMHLDEIEKINTELQKRMKCFTSLLRS